MRRLYIASIAALSLFCSCSEFQPAFTDFDKNLPEKYKTYTKSEIEQEYGQIKTVKEIADMYVKHVAALPSEKQTDNASRALKINKPIVVSGVVSTTDQPGNFYKSFYIQDETGGLEIKVGKNGLYNLYKPGQTIYVSLEGLTVGMYGFKSGSTYGGNGMVQVGFVDASGDYETAYIENSLIVDTHIFRGAQEELSPATPAIITASQLPGRFETQVENKYIGSLVTLKGMTYAKENFVLLYLDSNKNKKLYTNRIFLSDSNGIGKFGATHGITTLAMSKSKMTEYIKAGCWDDAKVGSGNDFTGKVVGDYKGDDGQYTGIEKAAYSVSQYFNFSGKEIQIRTSGYCKFCDYEIPADVLAGTRTIDVTGVLTLYQGSYQLTVNSAADFVYNDTGKSIYE